MNSNIKLKQRSLDLRIKRDSFTIHNEILENKIIIE